MADYKPGLEEKTRGCKQSYQKRKEWSHHIDDSVGIHFTLTFTVTVFVPASC